MPKRRRRNTGIKPPFRLTRDSRTCRFDWLDSLSEDDAYEIFKAERWYANNGNPICPACGSTRYYSLPCRPRWWKCAEKECRQFFSVTSRSTWHSRKISFIRVLKLTFNFANSVKGYSCLQLSHLMDLQYKSCFAILLKLREVMAADRSYIKFGNGVLEIDGTYVGGKVRKENLKTDRIDRRTAMAEKGMQRVLYTLTERGGPTIQFAADSETALVSDSAMRAMVPKDCHPTIISDAHKAYENLEAFGRHLVVDHDKGYSIKGISSNRAENSFDRLKRGIAGEHHHIGTTYLDLYGGEMCWRHNRRRVGNREAFLELLRATLNRGPSKTGRGYFQHWQIPGDEERPELRWEKVFAQVYEGRRVPKTQRLIS